MLVCDGEGFRNGFGAASPTNRPPPFVLLAAGQVTAVELDLSVNHALIYVRGVVRALPF